jgi:hypothetical protein
MIATTSVSARPATDCGGTIAAEGRSFAVVALFRVSVFDFGAGLRPADFLGVRPVCR